MTKISSTAFATTAPITFARGRNGDIYGVNGYSRGFRWDTISATVEQLGISPPANKPNVSAGTTGAAWYLERIHVLDGGAGYRQRPIITVSGTQPAGALPPEAKAIVRYGQVASVQMLRYGVGYSTVPTVTCAAPDQTTNPGTGASLSVATTSTTTGIYTVTGVTVDNAGGGYTDNVRVIFDAPTANSGSGAAAEAYVNNSGQIASVRVVVGGEYSSTPTASIEPDPALSPRTALLQPVLTPGIKGKYWCAIRYIDDTAAARGGPIPSSISELTEVEVTNNAGGFTWSWLNTGMEARADKIELWRTTADQALVLYRVATVAKATTSYSDSLSDAELADPSRTGFAALPLTLPGGEVNARRFNPPPQNKSVIVMFQDRAWYAVDVPGRTFNGTVDATAAEPNTLYFSEMDEPESVPEVNEIIIQENVRGQDRVTALMPFGGGMVVFQERNCYRLAYVSQPIIDASITLIGQRGCLNQRCWDVFDGVAYIVDSAGMYMLDGSNTVPLSDAVDSFWSDGVIDFKAASTFFVRVDTQTRIARFFFSETGSVGSVDISFAGSAYPSNKTFPIVFSAPPSGGTTASGYVVSAIGGQIVRVVITDSGSGYTSPPTATVAPPLAGEPPSLSVTLGGGLPDKALCFHPITKAWWVERYANRFAAADCLVSQGRRRLVAGSGAGTFMRFDDGPQDKDSEGGDVAVGCYMRTGNMPFSPSEPVRGLRVLYRPTVADCNLSMSLHYNNSDTPRQNAVNTDRGSGFTTTAGGAAVLNMKKTRSALGDATGYAVASYAGRMDDKSAGGDRHLAVAVSISKPTSEHATVYGLAVEGVTQ